MSRRQPSTREPICGPYGRKWKDAKGKWQRRLTDDGKQVVEKYLVKFPVPGKVVTRLFPGLVRGCQDLGCTLEEINAAALEGVVMAAIRWDPTRCEFGTAACWGARSGVSSLLRSKEYDRRVLLASDMLGNPGHEHWNHEGILPDRVNFHPVLSAPAREADDDIDHEENRRHAERLIKRANILARPLTILRRHICDGDSYPAIAADLGISRERVRQIGSDAMGKLQAAAGVKNWEDKMRERIARALATDKTRPALQDAIGGPSKQVSAVLGKMRARGEVVMYRKRDRYWYRLAA